MMINNCMKLLRRGHQWSQLKLIVIIETVKESDKSERKGGEQR